MTLGAIVALLSLTAAVGILTINSIVRPLAASIHTMQRLATGEFDLVITGADRQDELGSMAKAIEVFRDQAVENHRLHRRAGGGSAPRGGRKCAALRDMADMIETETTKALAEVSESTTAMTATAAVSATWLPARALPRKVLPLLRHRLCPMPRPWRQRPNN